MIVNLNLVAVVDRHPLFARLDRNANEDAGVVVRVAHLEDHTNTAVANLAAGPVEKSHPAARFDETVFEGIASRADMLPAGEVFAGEDALPIDHAAADFGHVRHFLVRTGRGAFCTLRELLHVFYVYEWEAAGIFIEVVDRILAGNADPA